VRPLTEASPRRCQVDVTMHMHMHLAHSQAATYRLATAVAGIASGSYHRSLPPPPLPATLGPSATQIQATTPGATGSCCSHISGLPAFDLGCSSLATTLQSSHDVSP
jgi:hypothetical protein